jgi:hypothetical protein
VQVIYRSSLERQMPDAKTVFAKLFSTLQLTEPQFKSVVVLFRNKVLLPCDAALRLCPAAPFRCADLYHDACL